MLISRGPSGTENAYTNDLNGNTLTGGGRTNLWDSENRLVQCTANGNKCQYVYGADGLRRQQTVTDSTGVHTTNFMLDGNMNVEDVRLPTSNGDPEKVETYVTGPRGPECRIETIGGGVPQWNYYLYDGLGSVVGEIAQGGGFNSFRAYDVYGNIRPNASTGSAGGKHQFVGGLGHSSDNETGLIYMRARYMDPATGRFISEDRQGHGSNWFTYANANPTSYSDDTGCAPRLEAALWDPSTSAMALAIAFSCGIMAFTFGYLAFVGEDTGLAAIALVFATASVVSFSKAFGMGNVAAGLLAVGQIVGEIVFAALASSDALAATLGAVSGGIGTGVAGAVFLYTLALTGAWLATFDT
jgi:RHS repeat-associated protein